MDAASDPGTDHRPRRQALPLPVARGHRPGNGGHRRDLSRLGELAAPGRYPTSRDPSGTGHVGDAERGFRRIRYGSGRPGASTHPRTPLDRSPPGAAPRCLHQSSEGAVGEGRCRGCRESPRPDRRHHRHGRHRQDQGRPALRRRVPRACAGTLRAGTVGEPGQPEPTGEERHAARGAWASRRGQRDVPACSRKAAAGRGADAAGQARHEPRFDHDRFPGPSGSRYESRLPDLLRVSGAGIARHLAAGERDGEGTDRCRRGDVRRRVPRGPRHRGVRGQVPRGLSPP